MDIKAYWRAHDKPFLEKVAKDARTTYSYLEQLAGGHRTPSPKLSIRLHAASLKHRNASADILTLAELRPDIWGPQLQAVSKSSTPT